MLLNDICKDGKCPELIKAFLYTGLVLITGLAYIGITSVKMAKPAMRVTVSAAIVALTIAAVQEVSTKVYIKYIFGTIGAMVTLAVAAINW
jgi:ABC-type Fe3+-siderophore transport system permease subunit